MYPNNNFWGNNGMMNYGYAKPKLATPTNPLTEEELALLREKAPQFSLAVSKIDGLKAKCTHRDKTGDKLIANNDGTVTCSLCGTTFKIIQATPETVKDIFEATTNCLETMKIMYPDIPNEVTTAYFQMIPFLEKGPQLYKIALDHYHKYANPAVFAGNYNNGGNVTALFNAMMNPAAMGMGMGMPQQMVYGQPMGQPGMAPQTNVPDVTMGTMNAGANPFDSASPVMNNIQPQTVTDNKQFSL